jgi:hypothetical protein
VLHSSIFCLYVCKTNNNAKEGIGLKKVPCDCNEIESESSYKLKTETRKQVQKTKTENTETETKTQSHENNETCSENRKQENAYRRFENFCGSCQPCFTKPHLQRKRVLEAGNGKQQLWANGRCDG